MRNFRKGNIPDDKIRELIKAAVQNILLSATDMGLGSCWCGDFDESGLQEIFQMDSRRSPVAIVAVG